MVSHRRSRGLLSVTCAALLTPCIAGGQAPPQQQYGVTFSPLEGHAKTVFAASFTAPFEANGDSSWYEIDAFGPPGCADMWDGGGVVLKGTQTKLYLRRNDMQATPVPRAWCPGSYIANVEWVGRGGDKTVLLGNFRFHVSGKPVRKQLPQDRYGVRMSRRHGTRFAASFRAPFDALKKSTFYEIEAIGPPECAEAGNFTERQIAKGQKLRLALASLSCPGSYIVNVEYLRHYGMSRVLLGNFRVRVRGAQAA